MNNHLMLARYAMLQGQCDAAIRSSRARARYRFASPSGRRIAGALLVATAAVAAGAQQAVAAFF